MGLLVVSLVGIVVLGGGFFWWQGQQDEKNSENTEVSGPENPAPGNAGAGSTPPVVEAAPPAVQPLNDINNSDATGGASGDPATPESTDTSSGEGTPTETSSGAGDDNAAENSSTPAEAPTPPPAPGADFVVPGPGEGVQTRGITDPDVLDLMSVPPLPKFKDSTDEEFAELVEDLELYLEDAGAQSNRAGNRVVDAGRAAFPVIINAMMKLDYNTKEGHYTGGTLNQLLYRAGGENKNYPWQPADRHEPGSAEFQKASLNNKKVVGSMQRIWVEQLAENDQAWTNWITKPKPKDSE